MVLPKESFLVEVVYATPLVQSVKSVDAMPGDTIQHLIESSGLLEEFPEISLATHSVGIFGEEKSLEEKIQEPCRVEIYRPLQISPKEARMLRAKKK